MTLVQQCLPWLRNYGDYKAFRTLLEVQEQIVAEIEEEQKLVEANKRLIEIHEAKIKAKIAEVWGE